jgi:1,4-dihydroxy-2-naphthoate polyprenyltransferase
MRLPVATATPAPGPVIAFLTMGRFKFLFQSLLVVGFSVTISVYDGNRFSLSWYVITVAFAWCAHLMTHYCNEYFDLDADRANAAPTSWTGGSRVLVMGLLNPVTSLSAAFVLLFAGIFLVAVQPSQPARIIASLILALAWFYTAPPLRLNYKALGEVTCASVLYALGPVLAYEVQAGRVSRLLLTCVGVVFVLQILRCLIMNLADIDGDRRAGKHTQAALLSASRVPPVYATGQLMVYGAILVLTITGNLPLPAGIAMLATLLFPAWVSRQLFNGAMRTQRGAGMVTFFASLQMPFMSAAIIVGLTAGMALTGQALPRPWLAAMVVSLACFAVWVSRAIGKTARKQV